MHTFRIVLFISLLILEVSCGSTMDVIQNNVRFDTSQSPQIVLDTIIHRSSVQVYVHPDTTPQDSLSALFVPFRMQQNMENFSSIGRNISYIIWQNWVQQKVFPILEFSQTTTPFRPDVAIAVAAKKGADLVIGGYINDFIDGGTIGDTRVSLAIEIYDVKTGSLLWSIAQAGSIETTKINDYILFTTSKRMPTNPSGAVINALADDMGKNIKKWLSPTYKPSSYKSEPSAF